MYDPKYYQASKAARLDSQRRYRATEKGKLKDLKYSRKESALATRSIYQKVRRQRLRDNQLCFTCEGRNGPLVTKTACQVCRESSNARSRKATAERKTYIIHQYGGKCSCCGESEQKFLTIDHVNNDGAQLRKEHGVALKFYNWIIRNNFPTTLRILCFNCNCGRAVNAGICPHAA